MALEVFCLGKTFLGKDWCTGYGALLSSKKCYTWGPNLRSELKYIKILLNKFSKCWIFNKKSSNLWNKCIFLYLMYGIKERTILNSSLKRNNEKNRIFMQYLVDIFSKTPTSLLTNKFRKCSFFYGNSSSYGTSVSFYTYVYKKNSTEFHYIK